LIDDQSHAQLADFGLVRLGDVASERMTTTYSGAGTWCWMSPELLSGNSSRKMQDDVYAFGCIAYYVSPFLRFLSSSIGLVLYQLFKGSAPFFGYSAAQIIEYVSKGERPPRPTLASERCRAEAPEEIWALIEKCWNHDIALRPPMLRVTIRLEMLSSRLVLNSHNALLVNCDHLTEEAHNLSQKLHSAVRLGRIQDVRLLLREGADVNSQDARGRTMLHIAISGGRTQMIWLLLDYKANVTLYDRDGLTPFLIALARNMNDVARVLMEDHDVDVHTANRQGQTPLHITAAQGNADIAYHILQHNAHANVQDHKGDTPLHIALRASHDEVVSLLLDHRASTSIRNYKGHTALASLIFQEDLDILEHALAHGADPNVTLGDNASATPLMYALDQHNVKLATLLLERGARVDTRLPDGRSVLHHCLPDEAEILLRYHADVHATDNTGSTPLHAAFKRALSPLVCEALVLLLLRHNADVNATDNTGSTPLHAAIKRTLSPLVRVALGQLLLNHGANPLAADENEQTPIHLMAALSVDSLLDLLLVGDETQDEDSPGLYQDGPLRGLLVLSSDMRQAALQKPGSRGRTPLQWAVACGHTSTVKLLLGTGVLPLHFAAVDEDGRTSLHWAVACANGEMTYLLLAHGYDYCINMIDSRSQTPLHYAVIIEDRHLVSLLLEHGADLHAQNKERMTPLDLARQRHRYGSSAEIELLLRNSNTKIAPTVNDIRYKLSRAKDVVQENRWYRIASSITWLLPKAVGALILLLYET
jgi:ankyrin repeat protein